jgi:hypothetical protein
MKINDKIVIFLFVLIICIIIYTYTHRFQEVNTKVYIVDRKTPVAYPRIDLERTNMNRLLTRYPIHTRGFTTFSNIGYLYDNENLVLPLYGKQTYCGSITWNYYVLDQEHRIRIPLQVENRDCMDQIGCKELYNDDTVHVKVYNRNFKVYLYKPNLYL